MNYAVINASANRPLARGGFADDVAEFRTQWKAHEHDAALAAIGDAWVDEIQIMGDAAHVHAKVEAYEQGGAKPIVFASPWGEEFIGRDPVQALA